MSTPAEAPRTDKLEQPPSKSLFLPCIIFFVILIPLVLLALFAYLVVNGTEVTQGIIPPSEATTVLHNLVAQARIRVGLDCQLGAICRVNQTRPLLSDGRPSHAIWDLPRNLMNTSFAKIRESIPDASIHYVWDEPLVVYFDNVLTEAEINLLLDTAESRFTKSMVVGPDGEPVPDESRTSDTAWIYMTESEEMAAIVSKVASLSGFTAEQAEHIGVNRYKSAQYFSPHYDFLGEEHLSRYAEFPTCQRASTTLIYLSDVEVGGESVFIRKGTMDGSFDVDPQNPDHLMVKPKRGRVLIWYDMHPYTERVDTRTLHGGSPVREGVKIAATIFIRNCTRHVTFEPQITTAPEQPPVEKEEL